MKNNLLLALLLFVVGLGALYALKIGLQRTETDECIKLTNQAKEYRLWYSTQAERDMCAYHGVPLPENNTQNHE